MEYVVEITYRDGKTNVYKGVSAFVTEKSFDRLKISFHDHATHVYIPLASDIRSFTQFKSTEHEKRSGNLHK